MKQLTIKSIGTLMATLLLFSACKKTETGKPDNNQPGKRLIKTEISANEYSVFDYNSDGTLKKITDYTDGDAETLTFAYNGSKQLTEISYSEGEKIRFVYQGNKVDTIKMLESGGEYGAFIKNTYQGDKLVKRAYSFYVEGEFMEVQRSFFTYSAAGNITENKSEMYDFIEEKWLFAGKTVYTRFDNKMNPLSLSVLNVIAAFAGTPQVNNVEEEKTYDEDNELTETIVYTYQYDADGYPTQVTATTTSDTGTTTETTKFTYK